MAKAHAGRPPVIPIRKYPSHGLLIPFAPDLSHTESLLPPSPAAHGPSKTAFAADNTDSSSITSKRCKSAYFISLL